MSKREVIAQLPCDGHDAGLERKLNAALTKTVYAHWQQAALDKPKAFSATRDELTQLVQAALDKLT